MSLSSALQNTSSLFIKFIYYFNEKEEHERVVNKVGVEYSAGGAEEHQERERRTLPKLKNPAKIWKNRRQQNRTTGQNPAEHQNIIGIQKPPCRSEPRCIAWLLNSAT